MLDFAGRVAVVSGAGRGIGRAHALTLGARGCRVVVNDLPVAEDGTSSQGPAREVVREIVAAGGTAVASEDSVTTAAPRIVETAIEHFGQLDILINNAGTTHHAPFESMSPEVFEGQVQVHLLGAVALCRAAWPHLKRSGTGRIVNTISSGLFGSPFVSNYAAGKGGLLGFSRALAFEGEQWGIRVNCVFPGAFTRLHHDIHETLKPFLETHFRVERVAAFVAWLVHQDTDVQNEMFEVGGGLVDRLTFARYPYVRASDDTPEAWAEQVDALTAGGDLVPVLNTLDSLVGQAGEIDPSMTLNLGAVLQDKD